MSAQSPKPFQNGGESPSQVDQHDQNLRKKPPEGHIEAVLGWGRTRQESAAGPSRTSRSQKINTLYHDYRERRKKRLNNEPIEAKEKDGDYADQLRPLNPKYTRGPVDKVWAFDALCTVMDFIKESTGNVTPKQYPPFLVDKLLNGGDEMFRQEHPDSVRWIHLPANNMAWMETFMKRYYEGKGGSGTPKEIRDDATTMQEQILFRGWWDKRQRSNRRGVEHARFMQPLCKSIVVDAATCGNRNLVKGDNMVLFIPFLHWETNRSCVEMQLVIQDTRNYFDKEAAWEDLASGTCLTPNEISALSIPPLSRVSNDEKLIRLYLLQASPLHVRRTLDQSFYYTLTDTSHRDGDQVVSRYMKEHLLNPNPSVLMVDQCWLWILNGNTVVTCFPQRWDTQDEDVDTTRPPLDSEKAPFYITDDKTDVHRNIVNLLGGDQAKNIRTAWSLVKVIVDYCSRNVFDSENMPDEEHQFLEFFSHSISNVMDKQVELFEAFIKASNEMRNINEEEQKLHRDNEKLGQPIPHEQKKNLQNRQEQELNALFDVTQECEKLKEIKDIMDELQMIIHVNESQEAVLSKLRDILAGQNPTMELKDEIGKGAAEDQREVGSPASGADLGSAEASMEENPTIVAKDDKGKSVAREGQEARLQATFADLTAAEEMIIQSKTRKEIIKGLYQNADRTYHAITDLLELKQKQANSSEARSARRSAEEAALQAEAATLQAVETTKQGYSIMLFTIVTILFLPLSSLASLFALNVPALSSGTLKPGIVFAILRKYLEPIPISVVVVSIAFILAFHEGSRRLVLILLRICYSYFPEFTFLTSKWLDDFEEVHLKAKDVPLSNGEKKAISAEQGQGTTVQEGADASGEGLRQPSSKQGQEKKQAGRDSSNEKSSHPSTVEPRDRKPTGIIKKAWKAIKKLIGVEHEEKTKDVEKVGHEAGAEKGTT